jgi:hypothetical protein
MQPPAEVAIFDCKGNHHTSLQNPVIDAIFLAWDLDGRERARDNTWIRCVCLTWFHRGAKYTPDPRIVSRPLPSI